MINRLPFKCYNILNLKQFKIIILMSDYFQIENTKWFDADKKNIDIIFAVKNKLLIKL